MLDESVPYKNLCAQYYELDKPTAPEDALKFYLDYAQEAGGAILEPMCGTGRFLIPMIERGYAVTGFDYSPHMLALCKKKCSDLNLKSELFEAFFETFVTQDKYKLIFIPSGSFCLLTDKEQITKALHSVANWLSPEGKFVFEIETLSAVGLQDGVWRGSWVNKSTGSLIVLNTLSRFDEASRIKTTLCRYELWEKNAISHVEVENFRLKLYEPREIEYLLNDHGFKVVSRWQAEPYTKETARPNAAVIVYECMKR